MSADLEQMVKSLRECDETPVVILALLRALTGEVLELRRRMDLIYTATAPRNTIGGNW